MKRRLDDLADLIGFVLIWLAIAVLVAIVARVLEP